jgi:hypothetical protein
MPNEYRCHNGQCISNEFVRDSTLNPDCLNRSDEGQSKDDYLTCSKDPAFRCEENTCRPGRAEFPCGDGQCTNGIHRCYNGRTIYSTGDVCADAMSCWLDLTDRKWCRKFCSTSHCLQTHCANMFELRSIPSILGHVRLMYSNTLVSHDTVPMPVYVCYDETRCQDFLPAHIHFDHRSCRYFNDTGLNRNYALAHFEVIVDDLREHFRRCSNTNVTKLFGNMLNVYRCQNSSQSIVIQRVLDGIHDCPYDDDETFENSCSLADRSQRFKCSYQTNETCLSSLVINDHTINCLHGEDENSNKQNARRTHIYFSTTCDGKIDLLPILIDDENHMDETNCHLWPCNNIYSRCDFMWLCNDGSDEASCLRSNCSSGYQTCIYPHSSHQLSCLPLDRVSDGIDDCLGGTDERTAYRSYESQETGAYDFHCWNQTKLISGGHIYDGKPDCLYNDDELPCRRNQSAPILSCFRRKTYENEYDAFICSLKQYFVLKDIVHFTVQNRRTYSNRSIPKISPMSLDRIELRSIDNRTMTTNISNDAW